MENSEVKNTRIYYLDILKILACFAVVMIHVSACSIGLVIPFGLAWNSINVLDSLSRFAVPIFFMASGVLFLSKTKIDIKKLYTKNILRLLIAYIFWILFYSAWNLYWGQGKLEIQNIGKIISDAILNPMYHLWFVPSMIGIYMLVPLLHKYIQNSSKQEIEYLLKLFFVFEIVRTSILVFNSEKIVYLNRIANTFSIGMFTGYIGYFILGYYLNKYELKKKTRIILYILGIISLLICILGTSIISTKTNTAGLVSYFYEYNFITTLFTSTAIFIFAKYVFEKIELKDKIKKMVEWMSNASFGIYLMHLAILSRLLPILSKPNIPISFLIIFTAICIFIIGLIIVSIIRKIPFINKYIV